MAGIDDLLELSGAEEEVKETREERKARREEEKASKGTKSPSYIMSQIQRFTGSDVSTGLTSADFLSPADLPPINVGTYSGKMFSAPIFATGGLVMNYGAIRKARDAHIQAEAKRRQANTALDYQIYQISDQVRGAVLIDKQLESYDNLVAMVMNERGVDINEAKRFLNEEGNELIRREGIKWNNFSTMLDKTLSNYHEVLKDQALPPSQRVYGPDTLALANEFTEFIANPENFDYNDMPRFARFYEQFNESKSLSEWVNAATEDFLTQKKSEIADLGVHGGENVYAIRTYVNELYGRDKIIDTYGDSRWDEETKNRAYQMFLDRIDRSEKLSSLQANMTISEFISREEEKAKIKQKYPTKKEGELTILPKKETSIGKKTGVDEETGEDISEWRTYTKKNVVELGEKKVMQMSLYGAISKDTGEKIMEPKNVDFSPMDVGVHYEVVKKGGIGEGTNKVKEGEWIEEDSVNYLIQNNIINPGDIKEIRYVEGTIETKEPLGSAQATRSIFEKYDKIAGALEVLYPGLADRVKQADMKLYSIGATAELNGRPIVLKEDGWYYEDGNKEKVPSKK